MLKLDYKRTIRERVRARCERHTKYDPEVDGRLGIRDRCGTCFELYELHAARLGVDEAIRQFEGRAAPWVGVRHKEKGSHLSKVADKKVG